MSRAPGSSVEYYLHHPEELSKLEPKLRKLFWSSRTWHPVVNMRWCAEIRSNGEGMLTYPDGTILLYDPPHRVDKAA